MRQKISEFGNINEQGTKNYESMALALSIKEPDFLDEIEEGIKGIVIACIKEKIDIYSSCQGHFYADGDFAPRHIGIIIECKHIRLWQKYFLDLSEKLDTIFSFAVYKEEKDYRMLNKEYEKPMECTIYFSCHLYEDYYENLNKIEEITKGIIESILNKEYPST